MNLDGFALCLFMPSPFWGNKEVFQRVDMYIQYPTGSCPPTGSSAQSLQYKVATANWLPHKNRHLKN